MKLLSEQDSIAVIGVSHNPDKYGHKVFKDLLESGYKVFAVNPKGGEVLGQTVYKSVAKVPTKIDLAVMVVPPKVAEQVLKEITKLHIKRIWFQPGSESDQAVEYCHQQQLDCITHKCVMVERRLLQD